MMTKGARIKNGHREIRPSTKLTKIFQPCATESENLLPKPILDVTELLGFSLVRLRRRVL